MDRRCWTLASFRTSLWLILAWRSNRLFLFPWMHRVDPRSGLCFLTVEHYRPRRFCSRWWRFPLRNATFRLHGARNSRVKTTKWRIVRVARSLTCRFHVLSLPNASIKPPTRLLSTNPRVFLSNRRSSPSSPLLSVPNSPSTSPPPSSPSTSSLSPGSPVALSSITKSSFDSAWPLHDRANSLLWTPRKSKSVLSAPAWPPVINSP